MVSLRDLSPGILIGLAVGIIVFANTIPGALDDLFAVNTSTWDTATVALFTLLPLVIVAFFLIRFAPGKGS